MTDIVLSGVSSVIPSQSSLPVNTNDWIEQTKRYLYGGGSERRNRLTASIDDSQTTVALEFAEPTPNDGERLCIGLEEMHCWTGSGNPTLERAQYGTTASAHSAGSIVTIQPAFSDYAIFRALNNELRDLSAPTSGLYQMLSVDLAWSPTLAGYDLTGVTDMLDIYEVRQETVGPWEDWPLVYGWELARNMPSDFPSGTALLSYGSGTAGQRMHVRYKAPFALLSGLNDDVETVTGLPSTALDIPPLGAAVRVAAGREVHRNLFEAQADTRRSDEVPPGAALNAPRLLMLQRQQRVSAEASRLAQKYPVRHKRGGPWR